MLNYIKQHIHPLLIISGVSLCCLNSVIPTHAQIVPDTTLPNNSTVTTDGEISTINGGTVVGSNLFQSFEQFSVPTGGTAYFNNTPDIQNIISRVTSRSISDIDGVIRANGTANLFLINPNGFIFGPNASLNIGGSFLASTANSISFTDNTQFIATATQTTPLLTVSVPIGLQFGATIGSISNQSQTLDSSGYSVGLQVQPGKTLALIGGDVNLPGGILTAPEGRIELGSVAAPGLVRLNPLSRGFSLSYEGISTFGNIQLSNAAIVDASGEGGGDIQVQGKHVALTGGAQITNFTLGSKPSGSLIVSASESVEVIGKASDDTPSGLSTLTGAEGKASDIKIDTKSLVIRNGASISTASTTGTTGRGGDLSVSAPDLVEVANNSSLSSQTQGNGNAGDLTINTGKLVIENGGEVSAATREFGQGSGGNIRLSATKSVNIFGIYSTTGKYSQLSTSTNGSGNGGNITIATPDLRIADGAIVSAMTTEQGNGGNVTLMSRQLNISNGAKVTVDSIGTGNAGNLIVQSNSLTLENSGQLTSTSVLGKGGGNISIENQDLLLLRQNSEISTNASGEGNGGNININTGILAVVGNSNITANAVKGKGGNIQISNQGLFVSPDSNITATSEQGINGVVEINRPEIEPSADLINLPVELVDVSRLIAQGCPANVRPEASKFIVTGRGGLPPNPSEATRGDTPLADLGTHVQAQENQATAAFISSNLTTASPAPLMEASGWVIGKKGEVVLTANAPTVIQDIPWLKSNCHA